MIWIIDDDDIFKFVISFQIEHLTGRTDLKMFNDITDALQQLKNTEDLPAITFITKLIQIRITTEYRNL